MEQFNSPEKPQVPSFEEFVGYHEDEELNIAEAKEGWDKLTDEEKIQIIERQKEDYEKMKEGQAA